MRQSKLIPYLFILPFFLFFIVFRIIPIFHTISNSLAQFIDGRHVYVGFRNYTRIMNDQLLWKSLFNTFGMFILYLGMKLPLLLGLSVLISKMTRYKRISIKILYIPTVIGMFAYAIIFRYLFTYDGVVNHAIHIIFKVRVDWFGNHLAAWLMLSIALIWGGLGFYVLLYINSFKNIPKSYYEIIKLNGGSSIDALRYVVLPLTSPVLKTIVFLSLLEMLTLVDVPLNLTQGGPQSSTLTMAYYIYKQGVQYGDISYSAAIGVLMIIICFFIYLSKKRTIDYDYEIT